jgi:trehalose/maltose transport system substrate-binding protein
MRLRIPSLFVLLALLGTLLAACGGGGGGEPAAQPTTAPAAPAATEAPAAAPTEAPAAGAEATEAPAAGAEATEAPAAAAGSAVDDPFGWLAANFPASVKTDGLSGDLVYIAGNSEAAFQFDSEIARIFTEKTGVQVTVQRGPESATERLAQYQQQLGAQASDIDVYEIDVIWPGIMAPHALDLSQVIAEQGVEYFPAIVENNTVDGVLTSIPLFTDAGLLYYRTDLLEKYGFANPPATWTELEEQAQAIQDGERAAGLADFWGFVWQGNAYEGLTCNALEWQVSNGGGQIIEPDGTISINNAEAAAAFERAKGWVNTISPPGVTTYMEEQARGVWQGGNAAFMRNWPYAYSLGQAPDSAIRDKFDVTVLPTGEGPNVRNAATLGGWQVMVSKYSENQAAATEFAKYISSFEVQKARAIVRSILPTIPGVYEDAEVLQVNPYFEPLLPVFSGGAVARPSTVSADLYNDVSVAYFTVVNQVLTGQADATQAVADLELDFQDILGQ